MIEFYKVVGIVGDVGIMTTVFLLAIVVLYCKRHRVDALVFAISGLLGMCITYTLKQVIAMPRPEASIVQVAGYAFPSGHATIAGVLLGLAIDLSLKHLHRNYQRVVAISIASLWALIICVSRVGLVVHTKNDVIVGFLIGVVSVFFVSRFFENIRFKTAKLQ
jgi:undecaprenyl-diphosphatase